MFIEIDYNQVKVPEEIIQWCDVFTYDAKRDDLRYIDCVYMNMGEYGNDLERLKRMREEMSILPVFD